jgi:RNA polymerase sigma-70 factor, ECF subfamily
LVVGGGDAVTAPSREQDSIERLVLRYREGLRRMCWSYLHDREMVEDVLQDTFCQTLERGSRLPQDADLGAWMHRVAANLCVDAVRRRSRRSRAVMGGDIAELAMLGIADRDRTGHPEAALELDVTRQLVRDAIMALPRRQRDVLILRDVMGHSELETAAALGTSTASVQGLLHRGRDGFRDNYLALASEGSLPAGCREATFVFEHLRFDAVRKDRLRVIERHLVACPHCRERFRPVARRRQRGVVVSTAA